MGEDFKISLLELLNQIKTEGIAPNFMRESSVTTIPKPGSKFELSNERGIFKLSVVRSLLIRLIYNRKYYIIDSNMTDSNIGARRKKGCRNHIWIINNINYEHSRSVKLAQLVLQSWDFSQMFDSMVLDTTISDLYDHGADDDLLVLLDQLNRDISMSVNTFYGSTEKVLIPRLVAQGDLMAPLMAAVQVDSISRRLQEEDREREEEGRETLLYRYKGIVPIPSLGLMDDSAMLTEVGYKSEIVNVSMNENSAEKSFQFNERKCKYLKIGKNKDTVISQTLEVDTWKRSYDKNDNLIEEEGGKKSMTEVKEFKYLGFIIASSASNVPNILDRKKKLTSTPNTIMKMTTGLGSHTLEASLIYFNSLLRASLLYACEAYVNLNEKRIQVNRIN